MRKVLVTGGAGYIGSHACKALAGSGYLPVVFDNLSQGHREFVQWGPLEVGDLCDAARIETVLREHRPVAVMHFAALALVEESVFEPEAYFRNNVVGSFNLLRALRACSISTIVFSSTCATYGTAATPEIDETHVQEPVNPYGASKLAVEHMLRGYAVAYDLASVALRYFNACGADAGGGIGERHEPETHLVPRLINAVIEGAGAPFQVRGEDYATDDGTCIRDYVHVSDIADAHVAALRYLEDGAKGFHAFNLGSGRGHSVRQVIASVERVTGRPVNAVAAPRRAGDPPKLIANADRAFRELGWTCRHRELDDMVASAWQWRLKSTDAYAGASA